MGFTLDQNTIRELAATIGSEVVKAISEAQLVNDARAAAAKIDEPEVMHVGPITVDLGRREATVRGRVLPLKPRELDCLTALARNVTVEVSSIIGSSHPGALITRGLLDGRSAMRREPADCDESEDRSSRRPERRE